MGRRSQEYNLPGIYGDYKQTPQREEEMFEVLSYFDNLNLSSWIKARTIITCATRDIVCPSSTIFAVYNHITSDKVMEVLPFYGHDWSALLAFDEKRLRYIKKFL
ncbi:MAG: acetylxylan esterase [Actinomycetota bacterium]